MAAVWMLAAGRVERGAPAELAAVLRLLILVAAAVLPIAFAVCAAAVLSAKAHGGGGLGYQTSRWLGLALYLLALTLGLRLLWVGARLLRASRAATVRGAAASAAARLPLADGRAALVLPADEPVAYTAGLSSGQVVVSNGLLRILDPDERRALLAHELAHARGGHQRMLFVGSVVAGALGFLPPVRNAFASLRRQIEAAADDQAVAAVGDPAVVARTLAKATLASAPAATAPAVGADLVARLDRLAAPPCPSRLAAAVVGIGAIVIATSLVVSVCLAAHAGALPVNVLLCLAAVGALSLPPLARRYVPAPAALAP